MILYGSEIWGKRVRDSRLRRQLDAIQRPFLLSINKAYRTTPTTTLQVIGGIIPLHIEAEINYTTQRQLKEDIKQNKTDGTKRQHPTDETVTHYTRFERTEQEETWEQIYVDATKMEGDIAGMAMIVRKGEREMVQKCKIKGARTIQRAEEQAIKWALEHRANEIEGVDRQRGGTIERKTLIITDSRTTIDKIRNTKMKTTQR